VNDPDFKELEEVRIEEGPFAGVVAKIVNTNSSTDRLNLMIGILGQDVGVSIPRECVARI
jgi:transcription antitermination factor NusG